MHRFCHLESCSCKCQTKKQPSGLILTSPEQTGGFFPAEWVPAVVVGWKVVSERVLLAQKH